MVPSETAGMIGSGLGVGGGLIAAAQADPGYGTVGILVAVAGLLTAIGTQLNALYRVHRDTDGLRAQVADNQSRIAALQAEFDERLRWKRELIAKLAKENEALAQRLADQTGDHHPAIHDMDDTPPHPGAQAVS